MDEVAEVRGTTGYRIVSTFSGCGGSCLGFEMAGFEVLRAHEFVSAAVEAYRANHPGVPVDSRDIRKVTSEDLLEAIGLDVGSLDVLEGSPPCASFSTAGKREKDWGKVKRYSDRAQRSDDLFFEFARLVEGTQPRAFVAENVSGLVKGTAKGYFIEILRRLREAGYRVEARLLDAQWLGVPQARKRLIFVGVRSDLVDETGAPIAPAFPDPLPYRYSFTDAVAALRAPVEPETDIRRFAIGREWERTPIGGTSDRYFSLARPHPFRPSPTITATTSVPGAAGVTHPTECRKLSIAELRRICAFPDDFVLTGSYTERAERLGRSVPPLMMRAVAEAVRDRVLGRIA
jgi:DNA (cytosine-5)-methyltransferase 1